MVAWTGEPDAFVDPVAHQLAEVLKHHQDLAEVPSLAALLDHAHLFDGLSADDMANVVRGLLQCRQDGALNQDPIFTSAAHILGSAKALKNLRRGMRSLGETGGEELAGELYVLTAGPSQPKAVVLIENIRSFTAFARSPHAQEAVGIAAYGYGLTMENFGARLAANHVVACPAYGDAINLKSAMDQLPTFFWGDLDREGLRIFESLREQIPGLALSAAYEAMESRCFNPMLCHPYHRLFEKDGQRFPRGSTPETAHLAKRCSNRAVDQEALGFDLGAVDIVAPYRLPIGH
ncbi:Wadjet anti-phage system protein JetD domain-containing protein [Pseudomonas sp. BN414]|uniref:Wadjet anti-phage system protein JetD domain-containing protein n=1 Tax=Pseudomonas sp. BN414 TaxID=2567888 RepID=UPI0024559C12|nr:Wadjet anti-phage system protein JetD domain-containing protein [Pseudomonas sp. BN414]